MRKIQFRGKTISNGEWVYGSLLVFDEENYYICVLDDKHEYMDKIRVLPTSVDELIDNNMDCDFDLYENDIIEVYYFDDSEKYVIQRVCDCFGGCVIDTEYVACRPTYNICSSLEDFLDEDGQPMFRVIGNIHDNPELLEVK